MHPLTPGTATPDEAAAGNHQKTVEIIVNGKPVHVSIDENGLQVKQAVGVPADYQLYRIVGHKEELIPNDQELQLHEHERFLVAPTLDPALISNPAHEIAVASVREAFPELTVDARDLGGGITQVVLHNAEIGAGWTHDSIDLETRLHMAFPSSPPYPYYGPAGLAPTDSRAAPITHVVLDGQSRSQISLNKPFDPTVETLGARLLAVLAWLRGGR